MSILLPSSARKARKPERVARAAKPGMRQRVGYFDAMSRMVDLLKLAALNLSDLVSGGASRLATANRIAMLSDATQADIDILAPQVAGRFVDQVSRQNKDAIERSIRNAMGVDFASILDEGETAADLQQAVTRNTSLIRSIGPDYWGEIAQAVVDSYAGKALPDDVSLRTHIQRVGKVTDRRAQMIARDQTAKLTSALNQSRQTANGIEEYIWRNSNDQRVVGNPAGLYPKGNRAHGNHWDREGKRYRWDNPPEDGNPGEPILCRCTAEPVLDLEKLKAKYV